MGTDAHTIELHFLHYKTYECAREKWEIRKKRINFNKLFVISSFFDLSTEEKVKRFERLPFQNKVIFAEKEWPDYPHVFHIHGYPEGLNVLTTFEGLYGHRKIDQFDYVHWFNTGHFKRLY